MAGSPPDGAEMTTVEVSLVTWEARIDLGALGVTRTSRSGISCLTVWTLQLSVPGSILRLI